MITSISLPKTCLFQYVATTDELSETISFPLAHAVGRHSLNPVHPAIRVKMSVGKSGQNNFKAVSGFGGGLGRGVWRGDGEGLGKGLGRGLGRGWRRVGEGLSFCTSRAPFDKTR